MNKIKRSTWKKKQKVATLTLVVSAVLGYVIDAFRSIDSATEAPPQEVERFDVVCLSGCGWGAFGLEVTELQAHNRAVLHSGTAHRGDGKYSVSHSR